MISIIVPVYNAGSYILQTIESVVSQSYTDWELLLVNDCSPDDSAKIIRGYLSAHPDESRIRLIDLDRNGGAAAARNTGLEASRGRYVAFLDADDLWLPDKLSHEFSFMEREQAAFVFCSYEFGDEEAVPTGKTVHAPDTLVYREALYRTIIFTSTVLFDTEKIGKDRLRMPGIASEDTALWWTLLKSGVTARGLDETLVIYRRPPGSLSGNKIEAVRRIWNLYRRIAGLSVPGSAVCLVRWAVRAFLRRV